MCGGGGSTPQDKGPEIAQIEREAAVDQRQFEAQQAQREAARQDQLRQEELAREEAARVRGEEEEAAELQSFQDRLNQAFTGGVGGAEKYFQQRGVDPSAYRSDIMEEARQRRGTIPELSPEVGSYFGDLGESVYGDLTDALRGQAGRSIREIAPEGFERGRIGDTSDDAIINAILAEQRGEAENYAQRLMDRGVITGGGLSAALEDIGKQANRGQFTLQELGGGILESGRGEARDIANRGRSRASALELGEEFDPYATVGGELEDFFSSFMTDLGGRVRAQAPGDLFDISGLPVLAGAAQGAGNTAFDPRAIAGILDEEEEEEGNVSPFGVF